MIIPIQKEGTSFSTAPQQSSSKTSSSYTSNKKSVRITPKVTEIEIRPRQTLQPESQRSQPIPVSILSNPKSDWNDIPALKSDWNDHSAFKSDWNDHSALRMFESNNKRWVKDDIENFVVPSTNSRSIFKNKFDNFTNQAMTTMPMFTDHPIKIDTFVTESDRYVLTLNVKQFKPDEIQVKVTDDSLSVTGKHEEKQDEMNFSSQEYNRKHTLPHGVKAEDVKCSLSVDGMLTISARRKEPAIQQRERTIPISGLPAIRV